jgi:hypothetical protein
MQTYIVPPGVNSIQILVNGAQGGDATPLFGGFGATIQGDFSVIPGQQLDILVGEQPNSNGGGGGSFVVENGTNTPLIIAGGGRAAGECCGAEANGMPGIATQDGTIANNTGCTPGIGGSGGMAYLNGGAGGIGLNGNGGYGGGGGSEQTGAWVNGAAGGGGGYSGGAGNCGSSDWGKVEVEVEVLIM